MPEVKITARQRVYYSKPVVLTDEEYVEFAKLVNYDDHAAYQWLVENGYDFENNDIQEYDAADRIAVTIHE